MSGKGKLVSFILSGIIYLAVFIFSINIPTDPDLGWHLKYGEYFFKTGQILRDNIFSTMMPDYHWVNHSWASDLLIYFFFNNFGFIGISVLGALVVALSFFVLSKAFNLSLWNKAIIFPILLTLVSNVNAVSFRSQMMSYFFTTVLIYILTRYEKRPRDLLFAIPLFLIWANFHGGFVVGLIILCGYIGIKKLVEFKDNFRNNINPKFIFNSVKFESIVVLGVLMATIINPFGYGVYLESFNHFGNPWLKYVSEWSPFSDRSQQWWKMLLFVNLYLMGTVLLFMSGKIKRSLPFVFLIPVFMILAFEERRYSWSMYYMSVPILLGISEYFKPSKSAQNTAVLIVASIFLIASIQLKEPYRYYLSMNWSRYCQNPSNLCSANAVEFLRKKQLTTNLSTPYSWGGWMIWNYPDVKPSIDGRMHLWKDKKGYSAFGQYYTNVQDWKSIDKSKYDTVLVLKQKPMFKRLKKLTLEGKWRFIYEDRLSAIFVRK
ncbi:MAG: hypothetical protein HY426_03490 [Candidatus Levybacteria bacterium]|nr:hypothetical protein [Candidatus Levybacteria bacterium]